MVFLHFDKPSADRILQNNESSQARAHDHFGHNLAWYTRSANGWTEPVTILLPASLRDAQDQLAERIGSNRFNWYDQTDGHVDMRLPDASPLWLVNASALPILDWDAAHALTRSLQREALVFGPPGSSTQSRYPETLLIDETGSVVKVERHYCDSNKGHSLIFGPSYFIYAPPSVSETTLRHIVQHGWGVESMRAMESTIPMRWSQSHCVLSSMAASHSPPLASPKPGNGQTSKASVSKISQRPARSEDPTITPSRKSWLANTITRLLDIAYALVGLIATSPIMLVTAILVKLTSRGPIFYGDVRQGLSGREFRCFKFRTMVADAAEMQASLRNQNEVDGPQFKIDDDPRLTKIGNLLRRYNIDELPQLWNVLAGQMSMVGPRPSPDRENQLCPGWRRTRLSVRPGITGLWQVLRLRDDGQSDFQEWIYYDVEYVKNQSFWLDTMIIFCTPLTMFVPKMVNSLALYLANQGICVHSDRAKRAKLQLHSDNRVTEAN